MMKYILPLKANSALNTQIGATLWAVVIIFFRCLLYITSLLVIKLDFQLDLTFSFDIHDFLLKDLSSALANTDAQLLKMSASYSYYLTVWDKKNLESKECSSYQPELSNFAANVLGINPELLHLLTLDSEKHRQGFEKLNLCIRRQHYGSVTCLFTE